MVRGSFVPEKRRQVAAVQDVKCGTETCWVSEILGEQPSLFCGKAPEVWSTPRREAGYERVITPRAYS